MAKFLICFRVEQLLSAAIEVEAESQEAASAAFYSGDYDDARLAAKLNLEDSEDGIIEIRDTYTKADIFTDSADPKGRYSRGRSGS